MKQKILLAFILLLLYGCEQTPIQNVHQQLAMNDVSHACPGGENSPNTTCTLADENNADVFGTLDNEKYEGKVVDYGATKGYLAYPKAPGTYPGVVMIHEWWGLNENIKTMANLLAQEGYVVLAVDLYNGSIATTSEQAGKLTGAVRQNPAPAVENMRKAATFLRSQKNVNKEKIGSMGWCFGGGQSLQLALSGEQLDATVIYYGALTNDIKQLSKIKWPVLGIFGSEDSSIPVSSVNGFKKGLDQLKIENEIRIYQGVGHAFANPSGARYAPNETIDAWERTIAFLNKNLKG